MTKIDEKYMDIKPQTNMHISEGWRASDAVKFKSPHKIFMFFIIGAS